MKLNYGTLVLFAVFAAAIVVQFRGLSFTVPRVAGVAIAIPAFLLFALARIQLGQAFAVQAKASVLVTTGLYSRIRNPIYIFGALTVAGLILWADKPWLLLIFAFLLPVQVYRSRKEERVLTEKFCISYLNYKRQTWF